MEQPACKQRKAVGGLTFAQDPNDCEIIRSSRVIAYEASSHAEPLVLHIRRSLARFAEWDHKEIVNLLRRKVNSDES
jgi:hypothetical protein